MSKTRIIIADDESIIRMDLKEMLSGLGYLVVGEAGDGQTAVNLAREMRPDLIIMDIKMPGLDGIGAAKILTEEKIAPVLFLTAFSQKELVDGAKEAGAEAIVVACPFCHMNLDARQGEIEAEFGTRYDLPVYYYSQVIASALGVPEKELMLQLHFVKPRKVMEKAGTYGD